MSLGQAEFNQLVAEHSDALYRTAYRLMGDAHDAEDVVQETFRSVWKSRERYESDRGDRAWLQSILRRRAVDRWRRRDSTERTGGDELSLLSVRGSDPTDEQYTDEVQAALEKLHDDLRETLLLVVVGELTHQEAADLLDVPIGTVLSRVSRARRRLRELLQDSQKHTV
ncbi:MAG: RNA polymerase sigma factor [Planctomycetales bacterium]|nr:RNA polymerase sigma factor [Planctomycetales bacterium]MBN8628547.1 RNA polymerase sigma factor [Planctomycetota bacterium]